MVKISVIKPATKQFGKAAKGKAIGKGNAGKGKSTAPWQAAKITSSRISPAKGRKGGRKGGDDWTPPAKGRKGGRKGGDDWTPPAKGRKGGGKGKGKPQEMQWVWMPAGGSKGGKSGGKGKGKEPNKMMDKLGKIEASLKVWVGGLSKDATWKKLQKHFEEGGAAKPNICEIMGKGTACCSFKTSEDAEAAISIMNGSEFEGSVIEVDVWTQKEKRVRDEGEPNEKKKKLKTTLKAGKFAKKVSAGDAKRKEKLREVDPSLKCHISGMSEGTTWKQLKDHFIENGCEPHLQDIMRKPGTGVVTFKTAEERDNAVAILSGTTLGDQAITVDEWKKPEKKEK